MLPLATAHYCVTPRLRASAQHTVARRAAVALAWAIRSGNVVAIPESGSPAHVKENAAALSLMLTPQELQTLDAAHPLRWVNLLRPLLDRSKRWLRNWL